MNVKKMYFTMALLLVSQAGWSAPPSYSARPSPNEEISTSLRQLRTTFSDLKNDVRNHEAEIRTFEEKLRNQDASFEQARQQLTSDVQSQRDFARASMINLDAKVATLDQSVSNIDTLVRGVVTDLRQLKSQANESVTVLAQYKQKMSELEKVLESQSQHMQNLEMALHSMMEVIQARESQREKAITALTEEIKVYKVQPGDTLEKIAKSQKVTLKALRDANALDPADDHIIVGQTLKIP